MLLSMHVVKVKLLSLTDVFLFLSSSPLLSTHHWPSLLLTNGTPALWLFSSLLHLLVVVLMVFSNRLIGQSMGIFRGAPTAFAACPPPPPSPRSLFLAPTNSVIQTSIQPSIHKMTLDLTEWSSIWIFTSSNRQ